MKVKKYFPALFALTVSITAVTTAGVSLAGFLSVKEIAQTVGSAGQLGFSIYLDPGKWDVDGALFYVYQWNSTYSSGAEPNCWISSSKKTSSGYYVYQIELGNQYTSSSDEGLFVDFKFVRLNPNGANIPSFDEGTIWNQTGNLSFKYYDGVLKNNSENTNNGFSITDWGSGSWNFNVN